MTSFLTRIIALPLFILLSFPCFPQNYTVKESAVIVPDYMHETYHPVPGTYVVINYASEHGVFKLHLEDKSTLVTGYDKNLRQIYSAPIKELQGRRYQGAIEFRGHLYIFYADNDKTYKAELDPAKGTIIGPEEEAFTGFSERFTFLKGFSEDSAWCYVLVKGQNEKEKDEIYNGAVMDNKMNIVNKFSFRLEGLKNYTASNSCILSQDQTLRMVTGVRVKSGKKEYDPLEYLVTEINPQGKSVTSPLTELPEGMVNSLVWTPSEKGLHFMGLLAKTKKSGFTTLVSGEFESWQKKVSDVKETELNSCRNLQNPSEKYLKEILKEGIPSDVDPVASYTLPDGAVMLILQKTEVIFTTSGNFSYTDTKAYDLYLVKIKANKTPDWIEEIPISQKEPTGPLYTSIVSNQDGKGNVFIFFQDNIKNEQAIKASDKSYSTTLSVSWKYNNVAALCVHKDGSITKKFIIDEDGAEGYAFAPRRNFATYNNEIIYTAYDLNRGLGKSNYRIGVIKIN